MSPLIQIRNVPEDIHRTLKARAALAGSSLSDYLLDELTRFASLPTREEMLERLQQYGDELKPSAAEVIREARDKR